MPILTEPSSIPIPDRSVIESLELDDGSVGAECTLFAAISEGEGVKSLRGCSELLRSAATKTAYSGSMKSILIVWENPEKRTGLMGFGASEICNLVDTAYMVGQAVGDRMYGENPESVKFVFSAEAGLPGTESLITAFLHRFMFSMIKNQSYKGGKKDPVRRLKKVSLECAGVQDEKVKQAFQRGKILASCSTFSASLIDAPPNYCNCKTFAEAVQEEAKGKPNLSVKVLDEKACADLKMGAFLGVAQGSRHGARLVHFTYKNGEPKRKVALVGKGITIDTGGYGIKPAQAMLSMKCDMAGAATVSSTALAVSRLELKDIELHCVCMLCENMVDQDAYRPGDILTASNGKTIEVQHTDAEGRLALADGLVYARNQFSDPKGVTIVDIATLTGACLIALGTDVAALFANSENAKKKMLAA